MFKIPWNKQPPGIARIDRSNPINKYNVFVYHPYQNISDLIHNAIFSHHSTEETLVAERGLVQRYTRSGFNVRHTIVTNGYNIGVNRTWSVFVDLTFDGSGTEPFLSFGGSKYIRFNTSKNVEFYLGGTRLTSTNAVTLGKPTRFYFYGNDTEYGCIFDGVKTTAPYTGFGHMGTTAAIGGTGGQGSCSCDIHLIIAWDHNLSESPIQSIMNNPYQIFEPIDNKPKFFAGSAIVAGGQDLVRIINETLNINEVLLKKLEIKRNINETVQLSESTNSVLGLVKIINEILNISEIQNKVAGLVKNINEALNINESLNSVKGIIRTINETVNISEANNNVKGIIRLVSETVNISEVKNSVKGIIRTISETVNIAEVSNKIIGIIKIIDEVINISEVQNKIHNIVRSINESLNISESQTKVMSIIKNISEVLNISETIVLSRGMIKVIDEALNITENVSRIKGIVMVIDETLHISENINSVLNVLRVKFPLSKFATGNTDLNNMTGSQNHFLGKHTSGSQ